jgi:hypothetical protein
MIALLMLFSMIFDLKDFLIFQPSGDSSVQSACIIQTNGNIKKRLAALDAFRALLSHTK